MVADLAGSAQAAQDAPVEVMILGSVHMDNPGLDLHNTRVGDVLEPAFQAEIARIADGLSRFRPTAVHVEATADSARERYALYRSDKLPPSRDEIVQLGFSLARLAGLEEVHGVDADNSFPYGPVELFARAHGQAALLDASNAEFERFARIDEEMLANQGIAALLRHINEPGQIQAEHALYREMLRIGAGDEQPGAEVLAAWYRRNLLICAQTLQLSKPGDRIVVIFGSGHAFLLRQGISETPGFKLIEANTYLPK